MSTPKADRVISHEIVERKAGDLFVDPGVQRTASKSRIKTMADAFDPDALGVITTSYRSPRRIHVVDGQHRTLAALLAKYDGVIVTNEYRGLTVPEEAALFRKLNTAKQPTAIDKFLLRCVEQDQDALRLAGFIAQHGWSVAASGAEGKLSAIGSLLRIYNAEPEAADATIAVVTSAWGHRPAAMQGDLTEGLGRLLARHGRSIDLNDLAHRLAKYPGGPDALVGLAKGRAASRTGNLWVQMAKVLTEIYNERRRTTKIPEWS